MSSGAEPWTYGFDVTDGLGGLKKTSVIHCISNLVLVPVEVLEVVVVRVVLLTHTTNVYVRFDVDEPFVAVPGGCSRRCTLQQANVPRPPMRGRAMQAFALPVRAYGHGKLWET